MFKLPRISLLTASVVVIIGLLGMAPAHAVFIGNIQGGTDFPQGAISFADSVVSYSPNGPPSVPHQGAFNAVGVPDYAGVNSCPDQVNCSFVSLGGGGSIVLRFDDNKLTGSNSNALDLWIFEVGPNIEDTFVDISMDGLNWFGVGKVFGSTAGIDIDAFGFTSADLFGFVRLTDDILQGGSGAGGTVGADIDAVGAITTVSTPIPEPITSALLAVGLLGAARIRSRRIENSTA